jgi:chromosome segregation ATPase
MMPWMPLLQFRLPETAADWFTLAGQAFVVVAGITAIVWRIRDHGRQIAAWKKDGETPVATKSDLDGVGERVKALELSGERRETRLGAMEVTVRDHQKDLDRAREEMGQVRAWMERSHADIHDMKQEIVGFISERTSKIDTAVHDLDKRLAVVQRDVEQLTRDNERRDAR